MRIGAIILARLDSSRLPGKALIEVEDRPLISYSVEICSKLNCLDDMVIATSDRRCDDPLEAYANSSGIKCFRGDAFNVADRFLKAMRKFEFDAALRYNGDSPLNDPELLIKGIELFKTGKFDLVTNVLKRTYPFGMSLEIVSVDAMNNAVSRMKKEEHLEHVTKYFYDHSAEFTIENVETQNPAFKGVQLAVDTDNDLRRFKWIRKRLGKATSSASAREIVKAAREYDAMT